ncbi:MAG: protein kinase [Oscillochloris sp.]|nr:protein kinase [Oscillochloris sp.]
MQELLPGSRYGSFEIVEKLGRGLTGSVYRAIYKKDGTHVALKFLEQRDASVKSYFFNEMGLLRRAKEQGRNHQHLVEYVASYTTQEPYCLATRFYDGGRELSVLLEKGVLPGLMLHVVEQVAGALDYLHYGHPDAPVVHRDVKPANIMVNEAGDALLIDLSAARHPNFMLENERGLGTPPYMPPEQYQGDEQPQTDQFALAMVAFQMLTGRQLLGSSPDRDSKQMTALRDSGYARLREALRDKPATADVLVRAVAFDWRLRYSTCEEFAYDLHRALLSDEVSLEVDVPSSVPGRSFPVGYIVMGVVAALALLLLIVRPFGGTEPPIRPTATLPVTAEAGLVASGIAITPPAGDDMSLGPTSELLPTATLGAAVGVGEVRPTGSGCALRSVDSTDGKIIDYNAQSRFIPPSVILAVLERRSDWYHVQLPDGRTGWCPGYQLSLGTTSAAPMVVARVARPPALAASPTSGWVPPTTPPEPIATLVPPTAAPTAPDYVVDQPAESGSGSSQER